MSARTLMTLGGAVVAHAALALVMPRAPEWHPEPPPAPTQEIAVELSPADLTAVTNAVTVAATDRAIETRGAATSQSGTTEVHGTGDLAPGGTVEPAPVASQGGAIPFGGLVVVPGDRSSIGLAGTGSYRTQTAVAGATNEPSAQQRFDSALNAPLLQHDREMGMLQEGPAIVALEDATRASAGPLDGRAVFSLTFDSTGAITGASVESSSSDRASWEDIARKTAAALVQKRVRVPNGAKGLALRIEVESKVVLPSGARSPISGVGLKSDDKGNAGLGANFDLSDIGSKPNRVVGARTIGSSTL